MPLSCPKCASKDTRRLLLIHREALSVKNPTTASADTTGQRGAMIAARVPVAPSGRQVRAERLSRRYRLPVSPPEPDAPPVSPPDAPTKAHGQVPLPKQVTPPEKRVWTLWSVLALGAMLGSLPGIRHPGVLNLIAFGVAVLAARMGIRAHQYNANDYPRIYREWEQSFMCSRCGEIFVGE